MSLKKVSALIKCYQTALHQRGVKSLAVFGSLALEAASVPAAIAAAVAAIVEVTLFAAIAIMVLVVMF
jgi:hypothetical protein